MVCEVFFMKIICIFCKGSSNIVKAGFRNNKLGKKQRYLCNDCDHLFVPDDGFRKMKTPKELVVKAIHQYNDGLSLSKVKNHLHQHENIDRSRVAVLSWVKKYSSAIKKTSSRL